MRRLVYLVATLAVLLMGAAACPGDECQDGSTRYSADGDSRVVEVCEFGRWEQYENPST